MTGIKIETKTNGYRAETILDMISKFDKAAARLFPGCPVRHYYYGDYLDMADVVLPNGDYGHFNVTAKRVSFNGHCGDGENIRKMESMTYNDELFNGKLLELAEG